ncbi:MAG: response regulator [Nitrospiraceae bacterium]|nr:response regulator [Nitrospiraceae bacterium]
MTPEGNREREAASILVVDDIPMNLEVMEGLLYKEGYNVTTALTAIEALDILSRCKIDMAILDVMMPGMNGFELCQKIKTRFGNSFFPVILVTALDELKDKITGLEAGADDFLTKPFHTIELTTKIRSLLRLRKLQGELDHSEDIILTLAIAIEAKDLYTKGHSERVGTLSMEFASFLGLPGDDRRLLFKAGVLHDIGKIGIDNQLLHKTGDLGKEELNTIKEHVLIGETICFPLNSARDILPVIRHHHERWDGTGFPDRLKGEEIPFFARITAITDSFDAMVSVRPYRAPYTIHDALVVMENERAHGQWDPWLIERFIEMMKDQKDFIV